MRRLAPLFVIGALFLFVGCTTDEVCYIDAYEVTCGSEWCPDYCDDGTGVLYCTDTYSDDLNCGGCGLVCEAGTYCWNYVCNAGTCEDGGYVTCGDMCSDLTDVWNCGDCGIACDNGCDATIDPPVCY